MSPDSGAARPAGSVGRGAKVRTAVLAATLAELTETGYAALTVENVAQRSGVHKTTIYRRWQSRENLVTDAVTDLAAETMTPPESHDIDSALRYFARALAHWLTGPTGSAVLAVLSSDAGRLPALTDLKREFFLERVRRATPYVRSAIDHGRLPPDTDAGELIKAVIAPIYLRLLVTADPVDDGVVDTSVRAALVAARAGLFVRPSPPG